MRDAGGDLGAVDEAVEVGQLLGVGQGNMGGLVELQQVIEILISSTEDFRLIDLHL